MVRLIVTTKPNRIPPPQEFLRYFLDGLSEDLNRRGRGEAKAEAEGDLASAARGKNTISNVPRALSPEGLSPLPANQQADKAWAFHLTRNDSEITNIFSGQLQSRIRCQSCGNVSYCFDPFLDLSVPLNVGEPSGIGSVSDVVRDISNVSQRQSIPTATGGRSMGRGGGEHGVEGSRVDRDLTRKGGSGHGNSWRGALQHETKVRARRAPLPGVGCRCRYRNGRDLF